MKLEELVGANIARLREEQGISQLELGQRLESYFGKSWTRQAVSAAEKGRRAFAVSELVTFALVLTSDLAELLTPQMAGTTGTVEVAETSISLAQLLSVVEGDLESTLQSADVRAVRQLIPMVKSAAEMQRLLYVSLRDLFLDESVREADWREEETEEQRRQAVRDKLGQLKDLLAQQPDEDDGGE